jgi:Fur family transcriptional regulator, ferric uptake regulator
MNKELQAFKKLLQDHGMFATKPRLQLFELLQQYPALKISELISLLSFHDQATVYRNIKIFEQLGVINRLRLGWESKLELSDLFQHHHHHMTCIKCGAVTTLPEDRLLEQQIAKIVHNYNFVITDHQIELRGICKLCKEE